ncbi:MAG: BMP family ABC transporter substrate-binding protein [Clostridiales bacterium]|nr:BMP family ABC transporter substrate-binding protein [Clostridiales bacterium]
MKKVFALVLVILFTLSLVAGCASGGKDEDEALTISNIKIGFVHISDPSDMGYTYNHDLGTQKMITTLGLNNAQVISKYNIAEDSSCDTALRELVEAGCKIIFGTSFGFEDYMIEVAKEYPDIQFCHATGYQASKSGLPNMHNYFGEIYQARYLSGIAAGLKTQTNKLGYVSAMPFAECISGYDGFYLGALSVNPNVTMDVIYTNSWNDPTAESRAAQALIDRGCDVLGQHCDSPSPQTTAQTNGVWGVGYNSDMRSVAPEAALTSAVWDWGIYLIVAVQALVDGATIPQDWSGGLSEGVCNISPLNDSIVATGTAAAIEAARQKILGGWDVFTGPLYDNEGNLVVNEGTTFKEPHSAPSFNHVLQGITVVE